MAAPPLALISADESEYQNILATTQLWGPSHVSAAILTGSAPAGSGPAGSGAAHVVGDIDRQFAWASVTKLITALTCWIAVEEGTIRFEDHVSLPGPHAGFATVAMLLSHAAGLYPDRNETVVPPLVRRTYSNVGIRLAANHLSESAGISFGDYCNEAVLIPLGMAATSISDPAAGATGPLRDLICLVNELRFPTLIDSATLTQVTTPQWPDLVGILPGFGRQSPNSWGLGVEIRGNKHPHWTGNHNSTATFGHFGQSGSMMWIDPVANVAVCSLASQPFGSWAQDAWPVFSDGVLDLLANRAT